MIREAACGETYVAAVASRRRPQFMPRMLELFPEAHIYIQKDDYKSYAETVPKKQLFVHPRDNSQSGGMNFALENEQADCVLLLDDDLQRVYSKVCTWPKSHASTCITDGPQGA